MYAGYTENSKNTQTKKFVWHEHHLRDQWKTTLSGMSPLSSYNVLHVFLANERSLQVPVLYVLNLSS